MTVTINYQEPPTNVSASLTSGGSLAQNTTYYVMVISRATSETYASYTMILSKRSTEISFTTDTTNLSADITWTAASGANNYYVYLTTTSGDYVDTGYSRGKRNFTSGWTGISGTSHSITTDYAGITYSGGNHPTCLSKMMGKLDPTKVAMIQVKITDSENCSLDTIRDAIETAGFGDSLMWDGLNNFFLVGTIWADSTATGGIRKLTSQNASLYNYINACKLWCLGTLRNDSEDFKFILGPEGTNGDTAGACTISFGGYRNYLTNITGNGTIFNFQQVVGLYPMNIGAELYYLTGFNNCTFMYPRITSMTHYSNNDVIARSTFRWWGGGTLENFNAEHYYGVSIYPKNNTIINRDCTYKFVHPTATSAAFGFAGYGGLDYSDRIIYCYDTTIVAGNYDSWTDLQQYNWSQSGGTLPPFNIYFSFNLNFKDQDGNNLENVNVKLYDTNDTLVFDVDTDVNGDITKQDVLFFDIRCDGTDGQGADHTTLDNRTPFKMVASKTGYTDYIESGIGTEAKITKNISLTPFSITDQVLNSTITDDTISQSITEESLNSTTTNESISSSIAEETLVNSIAEETINNEVDD